ncbi:MAG: glycosyltransferase [Bacteroidetes bacterium]|nr:glycosyltransferase [Bacteroidota bacterium]
MAIFILFSAFSILSIFLYSVIYGRFAFHRVKKNPTGKTVQPVSVIICARNEEKNLRKNLPFILDQNYPDFEVVIVNDRSDDGTDSLLTGMADRYPHLIIVTIKDKNSGWRKKRALDKGIEKAKNDILLLTDADCRPLSQSWIQEMVSGFSNEKAIVLGYGKYENVPGLFNKLLRYDAYITAVQYFSFALFRLPYMGTGRNLAYRKSLFISTGGFSPHMDVASGDDDLFVNKTANRKNTAIQCTPESFTYSVPEPSFSDWMKQKTRHLTTGKYYKLHHRIILGLIHLTNAGFWSSFIFLIFYPVNPDVFILLFLAKTLIQSSALYLSMNRLKEPDLLLFSHVFDFILTFILPALFFRRSLWMRNTSKG